MRTKMTRWQKVGLFAAGLLLGLFLWIFGAPVLTFSYALDFLILPALTWWLLYRIIRKGWRPLLRAILCILILAVSAWLMFQLYIWGHLSLYNHAEGEKALTHYQDDSDEYRNMPEVGDLGEPEKVEYHYFYNQFGLFFDSDCYTLICTYAPEDYAALTETLYIPHQASGCRRNRPAAPVHAGRLRVSLFGDGVGYLPSHIPQVYGPDRHQRRDPRDRVVLLR